MKLRYVLACGAAAWLGACAHVPGPHELDPLFDDARFAPAPVPAPEAVFALDDRMRAFLDGDVNRRADGRIQALYQGLHDTVRLGYDTAMTRTASEAFEAGSGNCLSLVILTGALAQAMHLPVRYQEVYGEETWSRAERVMFRSGHVNIVLGGGVLDRDRGNDVTIDFLPSPGPARPNTRAIGENTVLAMFYNNRAAESIVQGDLDAAYAYAKAAVMRDASLGMAYNTLGVVYARHGDAGAAERTLRFALSREPGNLEALDNLAGVVASQGRDAEAAQLRAQVARRQQYPPFWFLDQGLAALDRGDNLAAQQLFRQELKRMPYADEVHFALAVVSLRLGDFGDARVHLAAALENSTTQDRHDIYAAKLARMRQLPR